MCGRFAQALRPSDYRANVDAQLNAEQRREPLRQAGTRPDASETACSKDEASAARSCDGLQNDAAGHENRAKSNGEVRINDGHGHDKGGSDIQFLVDEQDYHPTYNVAPGTQVPIVRIDTSSPSVVSSDHGDKDSSNEPSLIVQCMRWGLLPHYTTSIPRGPDAMRTINARDDAVLSGRSIWTPLCRKGKRCIVFCQGFYEWLKRDNGTQRIAHFVGMTNDGQGREDMNGRKKALMPMAGLYETCQIDGQEVYSFTVITTDSNKQLNFLHDRMPVILPDVQSIRTWLGLEPSSMDKVFALLKPYDAGDLDVYPVPREMGKVGNDDPSFILPVSSRKDGIAAAFGRAKQHASHPKGDAASFQAVDANTETNAPLQEEMKGVERGRNSTLQGSSSAECGHVQDEALAKRLQRQEEQQAQWRRMQSAKRSRGETQGDGDARLAERLQAEENKVGKCRKVDDKDVETSSDDGNHGSKLGRAETENAPVSPSASKNKAASDQDPSSSPHQPSSKWSPDPFNPPVSPPRPCGGYSTVDEYGQGHRTPSKTPMQAARHGGPGTGIESSNKSPGTHSRSPIQAARRRQEERFKDAAKGSKDIRNFFGA